MVENNSIKKDGVTGKRGISLISGTLIVLGIVVAVSLFIWLGPSLIDNGCEKPLEADPLCLSVVEDDMSYCDNRPDAETVASCYEGFYLISALSKDNIELCDQIKSDDWKNICVAIINEDASYCDKVVDSDFCRNVVLGEVFNGDDENLQDSALFTSALRGDDRSLEICDQLKNKNSADMCKAIFSGDKAYCTKICNVAPI